MDEFRFPPNGKVLGKKVRILNLLLAVSRKVSIPSKRESAWQDGFNDNRVRFNTVSIPSVRESAWQDHVEKI